MKDPATGKRVSSLNPPESWVTEVPELRIVDNELWQAVKDRQASARKQAISTSTMPPGTETGSDHEDAAGSTSPKSGFWTH